LSKQRRKKNRRGFKGEARALRQIQKNDCHRGSPGVEILARGRLSSEVFGKKSRAFRGIRTRIRKSFLSKENVGRAVGTPRCSVRTAQRAVPTLQPARLRSWCAERRDRSGVLSSDRLYHRRSGDCRSL